MLTDKQCIDLVVSGYFRVDADGAVWRLQTRSRTGRVRSIEPRRADYRENNGYRRIRIGRLGTLTAHRLVWLALRGSIPVGLEVNHKNLDKGDNRIDNLELVTHTENVHHAIANGVVRVLRGAEVGTSKLSEDDVVEIRQRVGRGEAKRAVARAFDVTPTLVRHIVSGKAWKHAAFPEVSP